MEFKTFEKEKVVRILTARDGNGKLWIEGARAAELLGYDDPIHAAGTYVGRSNRTSVYFSDNDTDTIETVAFIDETGLECLIMRSHSEDIDKMKEWFDNEVLQKGGE